LHQLNLPIAHHEIVRRGFLVREKVILDVSSAIAEAQNEFFVAEVSIIFHYVPQNRPVPYRHHWFGDTFGDLTEPHTHPAAKQDHFHDLPPFLWQI
jgi:hypothetical protein